jgi:AraC family transcriptional activator of pyochelin receptor
MPTTVRNTSNNNEVHSHQYVPGDFDVEELSEERKTLALPDMKGEMTQWFFDGIRMGHSDLTYQRDQEIEWKGSLDVVTLGFNLDGNVSIEHAGDKKGISLSENQHNVFYMADSECVMHNRDVRSEMFMVQFNKNAFLRLTENTTDSLMRFRDHVLAGKIAILSEDNGAIDFQMRSIINSVLNCQYAGGIKKMFFLSKCFEMLVLQAQLFDQSARKQYVYCKTAYDKERIHFAKAYIEQNFTEPPTLTQLARVVGINEFKLKKGFKELFGTTVFNYLTDYRMGIAKTELAEKKKSLTQLAYELGYSSPQHFSKAFSNKFGVPPSQV